VSIAGLGGQSVADFLLIILSECDYGDPTLSRK
jgi:hypothetical protein